ncbi:Glycine cleavage system L protein, Dihydrolipoamide dehydrogenase [Carpediemonas membranifera]|uniref:Dihydrolipoyl dehydrogenase n=1 Tax=Carpediemonas membranifera TaxID=201153 RepID=A0A8J6ASE0_9EUKA|nr:Glycine cleavage system L protein, Dihydrolipoamide dehydrogenase [Carpediemonas membranifera]|eukprot:KAG9392848.1 Glycine cleavage system L protein, Dihydrolipoamide dehydrogenase [Carpediemonas membranifera]
MNPLQTDLAIIGGGPGGYVAAIKAAQLGLKVTCIEKRGTLGGTCLNVGCIPSKALLHSSHMYHEAKHSMKGHGVTCTGVELDLDAMMKQKEGAVASLNSGIEGLFKKNGVNYIKGEGKMIGGDIHVKCLDGSSAVVKARKTIIATGSDVAQLPMAKIDEKRIISSTGALSLSEVPKHLIVIGAGVIGLEMGSVWSRLGSKVTVVEYQDRIAPGMDSKLAKTLQRQLGKGGMKFMLSHGVEGIEYNKDGTGVTVSAKTKKGKQVSVEGDYCLVAIGRRPFTGGLGADDAGVGMNKWGQIDVDADYRTNLQDVYAIGDVVPGPMLAHKAEEEGVVCVERMTGHAASLNYDTIPGIIYTGPELAAVGHTEETAKEAGIEYKVGEFPFTANSRAKAVDGTVGMVRVLATPEGQIIGGHILGDNGSEMIHQLAIAINAGMKIGELADMCFGHPTLSEAVKEAALGAHFKSIHI